MISGLVSLGAGPPAKSPAARRYLLRTFEVHEVLHDNSDAESISSGTVLEDDGGLLLLAGR
jgi:hypothetical protein